MALKRSEIGKRIVTACSWRGTNMSQLATAIGLSRTTMSRIVTGDSVSPKSYIIVDIARHLEVSADYLLGLSDTMEAKREAA